MTVAVTIHDVMWYLLTDDETCRQLLERPDLTGVTLVLLKEREGEQK